MKINDDLKVLKDLQLKILKSSNCFKNVAEPLESLIDGLERYQTATTKYNLRDLTKFQNEILENRDQLVKEFEALEKSIGKERLLLQWLSELGNVNVFKQLLKSS